MDERSKNAPDGRECPICPHCGYSDNKKKQSMSLEDYNKAKRRALRAVLPYIVLLVGFVFMTIVNFILILL